MEAAVIVVVMAFTR
ncbi:hypothetical protein DDE05_42400 [Streptomyces cavourensis]|nr:hypothetical protein DDE05_42400 [Streptomyces cavourensis]